MSDTSAFQELGYEQSTIGVAEATKAALVIIKDLLTIVPSALPYIMEPSAILLFANLRAQSPYHLFGEEVNQEQKKKLDVVLRKHNLCRWDDDTAYDDHKSKVFSLVNLAVFNDIPNQYHFVKDIWKVPVAHASVAQVCEWVLVMERALVRLMESKSLPEEWLRDWWAPHNLRFGMLLGYPGVAISSTLWTESHFKASAVKNALTDVIVTNGDPYFGSHVSFYASSESADDISIKKTKSEWATVIERVYDAMPLKELLHNKEFAEAYQRLKRREE